MQRNQHFERDAQGGSWARPVPNASGAALTDSGEQYDKSETTDPLASDAPLLRQSEWPSSDELEAAMRNADPFDLVGEPKSLTGEIAELFGELEVQAPRDTVPSPPPSPDEQLRLELPGDLARTKATFGVRTAR
jgi:hypothetical protein